ncbi:phosphatidate cytidylyltransferase [Betaproteobacteria bacterium]|nr:phosphatidate cytidylyltransferase [Betaproteobacteria bacterium]
MLKQRIITAIVLFIGFFAALFYLPPLHWALLMSVVSAVAAWEWGGLAGLKQRERLVFGGVMLLVCLGGMVKLPKIVAGEPFPLERILNVLKYNLSGYNDFIACAAVFVLATLFWCLVIPFWLRRRWRLDLTRWQEQGALLVLGVFLIFSTWLSFIYVRGGTRGAEQLLIVMGIAWVSDISAYFAGRKFGGKKLAPEISPGKTWAGVWGALAGVWVYAMLLRSGISQVPLGLALLLMISVALTYIFLAVLGIMGDLFESLLKRQAGIKDSSNILPGHGGVLDRIDSLMAILPCVVIVLGVLRIVRNYFIEFYYSLL